MDSISSANVACGFHAGDPGAMRATIALAKDKGVAIGAHPGFPDLVGFGRREMKATPRGGRRLRALPGVGAGRHGVDPGRAAAARQGPRRALQHGVPRSRAGRCDRAGGRRLRSIARFCLDCRTRNCCAPAKRRVCRVAAEVFADRAYEPDGSLASRSETRQRHSRHADRRRARDPDGAASSRSSPSMARRSRSRPTRSACTAIRPAPPISLGRFGRDWKRPAS